MNELSLITLVLDDKLEVGSQKILHGRLFELMFRVETPKRKSGPGMPQGLYNLSYLPTYRFYFIHVTTFMFFLLYRVLEYVERQI